MFSWINKQGVVSDTGFTVQFTGRFTVEYIEYSKKMTIKIEDGISCGMPCIALKSDSFRYWDFVKIEIDPKEQEKIKNNFISACEFQNLKVIFE